ncbi:MAG: glycosyltransferase family 2 protein [Acidobacteriaceae bacterium]
MTATTVAAVIPAYNAAHLLARCLESVLRQTVPVQEVWVVNDGSTDDTAAVLQRWQEKDSRIHAIHQRNGGAATARNAGIVAASSEWVAFLDADDTWMPEKLERMLAIRERGPQAVVLYHDAVLPDGTRFLADKGPAEGDVFDALLRSFFILPSTAMVRREVLVAEGMFQTNFRNTDDYDLWLRLGRKGRFLLRNEPLTYYERQPTSLSHNTLRTGENEIAIFTGLLASDLTPRQRRLASRRLARRYFERAYHLRSTDPAESWRCLRRSLQLRPGSAVTWKLLLANLWRRHRQHATPQQNAQG